MAADRPLGYVTQTSVVSAAPPEAVYATIADLRNHLVWSGERADDEKFKLVELDAPEGPAAVGTAFASSGTAENGTFRDRSEVTVASAPTAFVIETDAHLDRTRGRPWDAHLVHRHDIEPDGAGSRITYTETIARELRAVLAPAGDPLDLQGVREPRRSEAAREPREVGGRAVRRVVAQNSSVQFSQTNRRSRKLRLWPPQR